MVNETDDKIRSIGGILCDASKPLKQRFRALFTLRNLNGATAVDCIAAAFNDSSALLKHELAFCLGQMQDEHAIPILIKVLEDPNQEPMVRHEAGEALGAIGSKDVLKVLEKYKDDPVIEVAETCQLAIRRINWLHNEKSDDEHLYSPYMSVDPTPSSNLKEVDDLQRVLLSEEQSLYDRYKAMFALRNIGTKEAAIALAKGLRYGSALFRHEVAYVLGQLQNEATVPYLIEALEDLQESEMVRHECAEALGSIANDDCQSVLQRFAQDYKRVVKESCVVALDMCDYENSEEFQYADALKTLPADPK
ncbi:hypothetical protein CHUAL_005018 [Chamberlinius hualienensis]